MQLRTDQKSDWRIVSGLFSYKFKHCIGDDIQCSCITQPPGCKAADAMCQRRPNPKLILLLKGYDTIFALLNLDSQPLWVSAVRATLVSPIADTHFGSPSHQMSSPA